jgi:hypothetical protein
MATLALTADSGRLWKIGEAIQRVMQESPTNASVTVTIDNTAFSVTLPSGQVVKV